MLLIASMHGTFSLSLLLNEITGKTDYNAHKEMHWQQKQVYRIYLVQVSFVFSAA